MMEALSARDRRTLMLGIVIIVSLVAMSLGAPRYAEWRSIALKSAERETAALARMERSVKRFRQTSEALAAARRELAVLDSVLLEGTTTSSAGASLAAAISDAAQGAEAQLGSIQVRRDPADHRSLQAVAAQASVSGDAGALALFLESLESGSPLLVVREWSISGGSASLTSTQRALLRMDVLVAGLAAISSGAGAR